MALCAEPDDALALENLILGDVVLSGEQLVGGDGDREPSAVADLTVWEGPPRERRLTLGCSCSPPLGDNGEGGLSMEGGEAACNLVLLLMKVF